VRRNNGRSLRARTSTAKARMSSSPRRITAGADIAAGRDAGIVRGGMMAIAT
jgi:hypothetical protein